MKNVHIASNTSKPNTNLAAPVKFEQPVLLLKIDKIRKIIVTK